jgi:hypothetical protein
MRIVHGGKIAKHNKIYRLLFGHIDAVALGGYIYKDNTIKLDRKYKKYLQGAQYKTQIERQAGKLCTIADCGKPARTHGRCNAHHCAWYNSRHKDEKRKYNAEYRKKNRAKLAAYMKAFYAKRKLLQAALEG